MTRLADVSAPLTRFRELFGSEMAEDDRMDFYANRVTPEGETYLRLETFTTPLLSRLILEEYVVGGRMHGTVITAIPRPETEVPIFFFQLGGVGDRSIAVLDISPTTPDLDLAPLAPVHARFAASLGIEPTTTPWLQTICSPYLLHCNYKELDEEQYVEAMVEYFTVWNEHFYSAGRLASTERGAVVTNRLLKFKHQLHHHDPAYGFFARAWGKPTADAFVELEVGDHPAFLPPASLEPSEVKPWRDVERNIVWTEPAQRTVLGAPEHQQGAWRERVEAGAAADGFGIVTPEILSLY